MALLLTGCAQAVTPPAAALVSEGQPPTARLPDTATPMAYQISLMVDPNAARFTGTSRIVVQINQSTRTLWLHGLGLQVEQSQVVAGGKTWQAQYTQVTRDGVARLDVPETLPPGLVTLSFAYSAPLDTHLEGIYKVVAEGTPYVFSQFEPTSARRAFVCFDEPRFKTPFEVSLVVPQGLTAISNMPALGEQTFSRDPQSKVVAFQPTPPLPTYLMAFAVGLFDVVDGPALRTSALRKAAVPLRGVAVRGQGAHLDFALGRAGGLIAILEDYFAMPYPFAKLDLIAVPDFAAGAMENAGAITFRDWMLLMDPATASAGQKIDSAYVLAHEMAHQWFGDWVTMPWWDDLWLNESFATWLGQRTVATWDSAYNMRAQAQASVQSAMNLDSLQSARRIRQPANTAGDILNAFDGITYQKGAGILTMFESYLGPERMRAGVQSHLQRYRFASADADMFLQSLSQAAGEDIAPSFKTFLDQPGVPWVQADVQCDKAGARLIVQQQRYVPVGSKISGTATWHIPLCWRAAYDAPMPPQRACHMITAARQEISLPHCPTWLMPNADGAGYYRWSMPNAWLEKLAAAPLSGREQLSMAGSLEATYAAAHISTAALVPSLTKLSQSRERTVVTAPMGLLRGLHDRVADAEHQPQVAKWMQKLYQPLMQELKLTAAAHESAETALLRATTAAFLARYAGDAVLREKLAKLGVAYLGYNGDHKVHPEAVEQDLADVAITAAAEVYGVPFTRDALNLLQSTSDATLRRQLVAALASIGTAEEAAEVRNATLTGTLRANETATFLLRSTQYANLRGEAWAWFKEHYSVVTPHLPSHALNQLPTLGAGFCTEAQAHEVEAFFAPKVQEVPGSERSLAQALEQIALCVAQVQAQRPGLHAYLDGPR